MEISKTRNKNDIAARKREKGSAEIWILFFVLVVLILLGVGWIGRNLRGYGYPAEEVMPATNENGMVRPDPQSVKTAQEVKMEESELKKDLNRANANVSYLPWPEPQEETAGPGSDGKEAPDPSVRP